MLIYSFILLSGSSLTYLTDYGLDLSNTHKGVMFYRTASKKNADNVVFTYTIYTVYTALLPTCFIHEKMS